MPTSPYSVSELLANLHPILGGMRDWRPVKYELEIDSVTRTPTVLIITVIRGPAEKKRLKFCSPRLADWSPGWSLKILNSGIYVADIRQAQWEGLKIEVGEFAEDLDTSFFAESVEEI